MGGGNTTAYPQWRGLKCPPMVLQPDAQTVLLKNCTHAWLSKCLHPWFFFELHPCSRSLTHFLVKQIAEGSQQATGSPKSASEFVPETDSSVTQGPPANHVMCSQSGSAQRVRSACRLATGRLGNLAQRCRSLDPSDPSAPVDQPAGDLWQSQWPAASPPWPSDQQCRRAARGLGRCDSVPCCSSNGARQAGTLLSSSHSGHSTACHMA